MIILTIVILSIYLGLSLLAALVAVPLLTHRFRRHHDLIAQHRAWLDARGAPRQD